MSIGEMLPSLIVLLCLVSVSLCASSVYQLAELKEKHLFELQDIIQINMKNQRTFHLHRHQKDQYQPTQSKVSSEERYPYSKEMLDALSTMSSLAYKPVEEMEFQLTEPRLKPTFVKDEFFAFEEEDQAKQPKMATMNQYGELFVYDSNGDGDDLVGDLPEKYKNEFGFGWNDTNIRGYVYATEDKSLVVISFKGTTTPFVGRSPGTSLNDKNNDNLMFSCCCGNIKYSLGSRPVCDCLDKDKGFGTCNSQCLRESAINPFLNGTGDVKTPSYYHLSKALYNLVRELYPEPRTRIWLTGHSLGGALAALVALSTDNVALTFEAPGEALFASRLNLHLKDEKSKLKIFHVGNNMDPIFLGTCKGVLSVCHQAGYAMETACHLGNVCTYKLNPTDERQVKVKNADEEDDGTYTTKESIRYHQIDVLRKQIIPFYDLPVCEIQEGYCNDCTQWNYI